MKAKGLLPVTLVLALLLSQGTAGCDSGSHPHTTITAPATLTPAHDDPSTPAARAWQADVHKSVIAGSWYPDNPTELRRLLEDYLSQAAPADAQLSRALIAMIVPHAGYTYSGRTAARAYALLKARKPSRVLLLAPTHHARFRGLAPGDYGSYETPLGLVPVDPSTANLFRDCPLATPQRQAHVPEHALEVQLPFLQVIFPDPVPPIVPILVGTLEEADYAVAARCLKPVLDDNTVVLVSSDFTHYGPNFQYVPFPADSATEESLRRLDEGASRHILNLDRKGFLAYQGDTGITICGCTPIALLLQMLPPDSRGKQIFYETSAHLTGDFRNSVSYAALGFFREGRWKAAGGDEHAARKEVKEMTKNTAPPPALLADDEPLSVLEKSALLGLARDTVESYVRYGSLPDPSNPKYQITQRLKERRGAFVTLKKHGELRGCIGYIQPLEPLYKSVQENAVNAASRDTRFLPLRSEELAAIEIEISALTKPVPVPSYHDIIIGKHGIILEKGAYKAVFLPQVAPEQGWQLEETLRHLSLKAGLPPEAWKDPGTRFMIFTAEVFQEGEQAGAGP